MLKTASATILQVSHLLVEQDWDESTNRPDLLRRLITLTNHKGHRQLVVSTSRKLNYHASEK